MKDFRNYLKLEESQKLLERIKDPGDYLIVKLLWKTGMRVSRLADTEKNWVDFEERRIK